MHNYLTTILSPAFLALLMACGDWALASEAPALTASLSRHLSAGSLSLRKQLELASSWKLTWAFLSTEKNTVELGPPLSRACVTSEGPAWLQVLPPGFTVKPPALTAAQPQVLPRGGLDLSFQALWASKAPHGRLHPQPPPFRRL